MTQLAALGISLAVAIVAGVLTGMCVFNTSSLKVKQRVAIQNPQKTSLMAKKTLKDIFCLQKKYISISYTLVAARLGSTSKKLVFLADTSTKGGGRPPHPAAKNSF